MLRPNLESRYGDSAVHFTYKYLLSLYRKKGSQLGLIFQNNEPVAGSLTEFIGGKLRMTVLGILDGREDIFKTGVTGLIYYYEMLDGIEKGMKAINIGGTSPILTDGLTRFKLKLGAKAEEIKYFSDLSLLLVILKESDTIKMLLKLNPFIFRISKNLYRAIFVDPEDFGDKHEFMGFLKHTHCENIHGTRIYCFKNPEKIVEWIKEEDYQDMQVLSYQNTNIQDKNISVDV